MRADGDNYCQFQVVSLDGKIHLGSRVCSWRSMIWKLQRLKSTGTQTDPVELVRSQLQIVFDQVKVFDQVGLINLQNNAADSLSRLQLGRPQTSDLWNIKEPSIIKKKHYQQTLILHAFTVQLMKVDGGATTYNHDARQRELFANDVAFFIYRYIRIS